MALGEGLLRLIRESFRFRERLLIAAVALVTLATTRLYLTWLVKLWMEVDPAAESGPTLTFLLTSATLTTLLMVLAIMVSEYLVSDVNQRMLQVLRQQAQHKLLTMGVAGVWQFHSGELLSRLFSDVGILSGFVRRVLTDLLGETLLAAGAIAMMFYLNWRLTLIMCLVVPVVGLTLNQLSGMIRKWAGTAQSGLGMLSSSLAEQLHGMSTIKGYQAEDFEHRRFVEQSTAYRRQFMRCELWATTLISLIWLITTIGFIGIVWYGSKQVLQGKINLGALLAFCLYAAQTIEPIRKLSDVYAALQRFVAAAARIFEVIDSKVAEPDGSIVLRRPVDGEIEFDNVEFSYRTGEPVLNGIQLTLKAGERAALVAPSGGGKSTLARLLVRSYDVQQGRILLDGIGIRDLRLMDLRRMVCVVEQDPFMFGGPLVDNIRYGSWDAPQEKIEEAVSIVGLEPLVSSLPQGLHSALHEGGRNLSGGQKQRIALARAIVRDPRILILDEATSALDSDGERQILERMEDWLAQRTVLVMAHRLATVARMPRVIVLVEGRIAGDGTLSELLEECLPFRRMFGEQLEPLACSLHGSASER
jgi:ATP-binding cassette, subfamily B, bacterial MsbA